MNKKLHKLLFPGWGVPIEEYAGLDADEIIDYGFFSEEKDLELLEPDEWISKIQPKQPYILIAHSMGSLFVLRNSQLRDNAEAIIIIGGFAKFAESNDNPDGKPAVEVSIMQKQLKRNPKLLLKSFYRGMTYPAKIKIRIPELCNVSQLNDGLELLKICDIRKNLENIQTPVFIIHGDQDTIVSAKLAENLHTSIKASELTILTEKGHALPFTDKESINTLLDSL